MDEYLNYLVGDNKSMRMVWSIGTILLLAFFIMGDDFSIQLKALTGTVGYFIAICIMLPACIMWLYVLVLLPSYLMKRK